MNRLNKAILFFIIAILAFGSVVAQDDTRTFEITSDILVSRVHFTYSTQLAQDAVWRWIPASHEIDVPTGPVPEYTQVVFQNYSDASGWQETGQSIYIYPTVTFSKESTAPFTQELTNLRNVLAARPNLPDTPLPMLPVVTASQILRSHVEYIDFPGGSGIRYITAAGLDVSPLSNQVLFYTFQGLTIDGAYYIAAQFPVKSPVLPDVPEQMTTEQYNQFAANYDTYLADVTQQLDALDAAAFSPDLGVMDNLFASLVITPPTATFLTPDNADTGTVTYDSISFSYAAQLASRVEVDLIPPFVDTGNMSMFGSQPGFTIFSLFGYPLTPANNFAKVRVMAVDSFPASDSIADQELAKLKTFLSERPTLAARSSTSAPENAIPMLPLINAAQVIVAQPEYIDFQNGFGVRFITFYSQAINPVTNDAIYYAFIGMTADGKYVISAQFPVNTSVLPEVDPTTLDYDAFAANYVPYLAKTVTDMDAASYTPDLTLLDNLLRSVKID